MAKKRQEDMQRDAVLNYKANGGDMKKAMIDAGYAESTARAQQRRLLNLVGQEIKDVQNEIDSPKIKTITEIQEFWSENMDDVNCDMQYRVKCSELLAKSQGAFVENVNVNGRINNPMAGLTTEELKKLVNSG